MIRINLLRKEIRQLQQAQGMQGVTVVAASTSVAAAYLADGPGPTGLHGLPPVNSRRTKKPLGLSLSIA